MKLLLSIKPEYVEKIFDGTKRYEYRKCAPKRPGIQTVIVYSTQPVGQIVGEFDIEGVLCDEPSLIWDNTREQSGIDEAFFEQYYKGREQAVAIKIGETRLYPEPVNPNDLIKDFVAPQSFRYVAVSTT